MTSLSAGTLSSARLDALKEVANIGAGHAATALSTLTGSRIMISVPMIKFVLPDDEARKACVPEADVLAVVMQISGGINGRTAFILPTNGGLRLAERMLGRPIGSALTVSELEESAVMEAGNIIGGAYLTALSEFLGMRLMPTPPQMLSGPTEKALAKLFPPDEALEPVLCVETEFEMFEPAEMLRGFFVLVPDSSSFEAIFSAVRVV
jgi:chemotaxis protein CheC